MSRPPVVGVLALQGDVREHLRALTATGADVRAVRRPAELAGLSGIVLPGGESTTIDKLSRIFGLREPLIAALRAGLPAYGSCAGMILLAKNVLDGTDDQQTLGALDITVRRNAFGRQVESFEADVDLEGIEGVRCMRYSSAHHGWKASMTVWKSSGPWCRPDWTRRRSSPCVMRT